ncbi:MerR family transcriptional regulator [Streptomyces venezuelae]|uniref:TioE family transcriptional regulator n=1 Tax=Streptomyces venezuelae TaxID=54571 RepID=UPI00123AE3E0|nr:TioE family transcriptional regulator [Streptomyces venezuelae]QES04349.1 MerR family transcriptional regulator [Streptomyces venezuelae]
MGRNLQSGVRLRPVDLAREHGLSTQAVRNYEEAGILPAAARTPHGYRGYTPLHAAALRAFLALVPGHGHATATAIMRAVNEGATEEAFRLVDESHAQLLDDRRTLRAVETALRDLDPAPVRPRGAGAGVNAAGGTVAGAGPVPAEGPVPAGRSVPAVGPTPDVWSAKVVRPSPAGGSAQAAGPVGTFIGPLARQLGIRPATLRAWEDAGLVRPRRDPRTGYRVYEEADVRDARLAHQLRRGGHPLEQIAALIAQVRAAGGLEPLAATLAGWHGRLTARGRALLAGAAELEAYLRARG